MPFYKQSAGDMASQISRLVVSVMLVFWLAGGLSVQAAPKGKPFIEVNGQIVELQNDVNELESLTSDIVSRIDGLELDFQAQIDLLGTEIDLANLSIEENSQLIQSLVETTEANGYDINFALSELVRLEQALESTKSDAMATAADVTQVQDELNLIRDDIAQNASGLLAAVSDIRLQSSLVTQLQSMTSDLAVRIETKQDDIDGGCPAGSYIGSIADEGNVTCYPDDFEPLPAGSTCAAGQVMTGFNTDGSIKCETIEQGTEVTGACPFKEFVSGIGDDGQVQCRQYRYVDTVRVFSPSLSLNNTETEFCNIEVLGVCISFQSQLHRGDRVIDARCPLGYDVTGGGFDYSPTRGPSQVIVAKYSVPKKGFNYPSGQRDAWSVSYFNTSNSATSGYAARTYAVCVNRF